MAEQQDNSGTGPAKLRANLLARYPDGRPKISWANVWQWYDRLGPEDQKHVREMYPEHPLFTGEGDGD